MTDDNRQLLSDCLKMKLEDFQVSKSDDDLKQVKELLDKELEATKQDDDFNVKQAERVLKEKLAVEEREDKLALHRDEIADKKLSAELDRKFRIVELVLKGAGIVTPIVLFVANVIRERKNLRAISNFELSNTWTTTAGKVKSKQAFDIFKM